jgi:gliding motility-associated-like protein
MTFWRIFSVISIIILSSQVYAQLPENVLVKGDFSQIHLKSGLACADNDAGAITGRSFIGNNQSNDIQFLCFNDSLFVDHSNIYEVMGDPNPGTVAGVGYAIYNCIPTIDGMDLATIEMDPCLVTNPAPPSGNFWIYTDQINGDALFNNILFPGPTTIMDFYNNGDPVLLYYAPITIDDHMANTYENGGPCVSARVDQAFPLVYLNPIEASISEESLTCNCDGDIELYFEGGLPEFDASTDYTLTVTDALSGAPIVLNQRIMAGDTFFLNVPGPGDYELFVEDGVSCEYLSIESFCSGNQVDLNIADGTGGTGDIVCLPVSVECLDNVLGFQFTLEFDGNLLRFDTMFSDLFNITAADYNLFNQNELIVTWSSPTLDSVPVMDGDVFITLCFEIIGNNGCIEIDINSIAANLEILLSDGIGGIDVLSDSDILVRTGKLQIESGLGLQQPPLVQDVITCPGDTTGSIRITPEGGTPPYTIVWQTPIGTRFTEDLINIPAGIYYLTILDSEVPPNEYTDSVVVNGPPEIDIQISGLNPSCFDGFDGCLIVDTIIGGTPPYSWNWTDIDGSVIGTPNQDTICGFGRGLFNFNYTDANGCEGTEILELTASAITIRLDTNTTILRESCNPGGDGRLSLIINGGDISQSGDYRIYWSTGDSLTANLGGLSAGNYSVTVLDDNDCESIRSNLIISPPQAPFITTFDSTSINCPGGSDGILIAFYQSPLVPLSRVEWSNGDVKIGDSMRDTIVGLSSGWYYITVTAEDGCQGVDSAFLAEPPGVEFDPANQVNPSCFGYNDGSITLNPRSNVDDITVSWSNGDTGFSIDSLTAGRYVASFTDTLKGCIIDSFVLDIVDPPGMVFTYQAEMPASCFDQNTFDCDGTATLIVNGGNAPNNSYDISWSNGQIDGNTNMSVNSRLCAGINTVTVIDENGCELTDSIDVGSPPELLLNQTSTIISMPSCRGFSDGEIRLAVEGGSSPYMATWQDGQTGLVLDSLEDGSYNVTIEDQNGCRITPSIIVRDPDSFFVFTDISNSNLSLDCSGDMNGSVTILSSTNENGLMYNWSPIISSGSQALNLGAGNYAVTVTTLRGCVDSTRAVITGVPPINFELPSIIQPPCFGDQAEFTVVSATGGNGGPYVYKILEEGLELAIGETLGLFAGDYTVAVVDGQGCERDTVISINQPQELLVNIPYDTIIRGQEQLLAELGEDKDVFVQYTPINTTVDSIVWIFEEISMQPRFNVDSTRVITNFLSSQFVEVQVTDENGCIGTDRIFVKVDKDRNIFIPSAFSPNNDNHNDLFTVYAGPGVSSISSFKVLDRWGNLVYVAENTDPLVFTSNAVGWDGTYNGKELNPAVFVYLIEVEFNDGEILLYRGDITLVK